MSAASSGGVRSRVRFTASTITLSGSAIASRRSPALRLMVRGISDLISHETGIFVHIAEDPLLCVVNGCGQVLEDWKRLQRVVDTPEFVRAAAGV